MTWIDGMQGRYLLLLLPFLAFAWPMVPRSWIAPHWRTGLRRACVLPANCAESEL